jgi:hypothetical protein
MRITRRLKGKDLNEDGPPNGAYPITQTESKANQLRFLHPKTKVKTIADENHPPIKRQGLE